MERNLSQIFKVITNDDLRKRDCSVTNVSVNGLDDRVRFMVDTWNFSLLHHYHTGSAVETTLRPVGPPEFLLLDESI